MTWVGRGGTNVAFGDMAVAEIIIRNQFLFFFSCHAQGIIFSKFYLEICAKKSPSISKTDVVAAGGAWFRHQKDEIKPKPVNQKKPKKKLSTVEEPEEEVNPGKRTRRTSAVSVEY